MLIKVSNLNVESPGSGVLVDTENELGYPNEEGTTPVDSTTSVAATLPSSSGIRHPALDHTAKMTMTAKKHYG